MRTMVLSAIALLTALTTAHPGPDGTPQNRRRSGGDPPELLYYVDGGELDDGSSTIYELVLDDTGHVADFTEVIRLDSSLGFGEWDNVDVLAATPDGGRLYFIDDGETADPNGRFGYYDFDSESVTVVGLVVYSDTGPTPPNQTLTDLGSFSADGTLYIARADTDAIYRVDLTTGSAIRVGRFRVSGTSAFVNLLGADIAFDSTGRLYIWANGSASGAPRGLYSTANTGLPPAGDIEVIFLGENGNTLFYNGLAFRDAGRGHLVGTSGAGAGAVSEIYRYSGGIAQSFLPSLAAMGSGDMTTGPLAVCTRTIGYWKNHSWNGRTVVINGEIIDETTGKKILRSAKSTNFSMLFAQLIGAKLNCGGCAGAVVEAEAFLSASGITVAIYDAPFADRPQRREARRLSAALDIFNNSRLCD